MPGALRQSRWKMSSEQPEENIRDVSTEAYCVVQKINPKIPSFPPKNSADYKNDAKFQRQTNEG